MRSERLVGAIASGLAVVALASAANAVAERTYPYVSLGGYWIDKHEKYGWGYTAQRPGPPDGSGPYGSRRPCIGVSAYIREGRSLRVSESELCYARPEYLAASSEPLVVAKTIFSNDEGSATAVGVAAPHAARYLRLRLDDGYRTIPLHRLSPPQARKSHLKPFRHAGFLLRGEWCIEAIEILSESKKILWDSGSADCAAVKTRELNAATVRQPGGSSCMRGGGSRDCLAAPFRAASFLPDL